MRKKITYELIKTDDGEIVIPRQAKLNQQLQELAPGKYKGVLEKEDIELTRLKKYYFGMETSLSQYLGMTKTELHEALKDIIGQKMDEESGKVVYESIAAIKDSDTMMQRVQEFQHWAATEHNYTFEPLDL